MGDPNEEIEWERERLGPEWMDGTPFLSPHQHPLWKGFMDTHEITAQRLPPFNRTLILEQYKVLERLAERTDNKGIPVEHFGRFWPRHFFYDGKPRGESSTPYNAETAKHVEVNLQVLTYYCNGRPQIDMPDGMRDVFLEYEQKVPKEMEEHAALVKENKYLKEEERRLKGVIKALEEEKEVMRVQWNQMYNNFNTQQQSYESRINNLEQEKDAAVLDHIKRNPILADLQGLRHHFEELTKATSKALSGCEILPEVITPELPTTFSPGEKRSLPPDGAETKITRARTPTGSLQMQGSYSKAIDGCLNDTQHMQKRGLSPIQNQPAVKKLKVEKAFEQTSLATALNISLAGGNTSPLTALPGQGLSTPGDKPLPLSSVPPTKGPSEKQACVASKAGGNPKQTKSSIADSRSSVRNTVIGSSPKRSRKATRLVPGQPDFTGTMALSQKLNSGFYDLARISKRSALVKFGVVPRTQPISDLTCPVLSQDERFFALILWQGYQSKIAELVKAATNYTQMHGGLAVLFFRDLGYANGDPVPLTQTALDEGTLRVLSNITLGHLTQRNPAIAQKHLQSALRKPFRYTSIRELSDGLTKKGLRYSNENLAREYIDFLKPRFEQELRSCSNQIPTLLVFTPHKLSAAKRFNLQTEIYFHLEEQNGDINSEAVAEVLAKQEFTFQELTELFETHGWKYDSGVLAKAIFSYEATSCG
ncbi:hypothetical protein GX51_07148 [Blastomyces parvus]|uniref:Uncharacterized protein n=1 Tax=Blastomyces parvus TaxID=2060905 RepID=A0A2B7WMN9_9EURO|nr:hypothetical protein GX51_07148 [Blastomyces parvus]